MVKKPKIIVVIGPTASGKTGLAIKLAKKYNGEIVSCDSRQIYKEMNIGTNKSLKQESKKVREHLIDIVRPDQVLTLYQWQKLAFKSVDAVLKKGKLPILCGGTGLYISSILENYQIPQKKGKPKYDALILGIKVPRAALYEDINKRVLTMVRQGLEKEVKSLMKKYSWQLPAMHGIGYREWIDYFDGKATKRETIKKIQQSSRNYAKRQMTWFRGMEKKQKIHWIETKEQASPLVRQLLSTPKIRS